MKLEIRGLERLNRRLDRMAGDVMPDLKKATDRAVKFVHSRVPKYPPAPVGSTYRRTGTLGREIGTEVRALSSEIVGVIGTADVKAPWVISDRRVGSRGPQTWWHEKNGWYTLQGVVMKARDGIIAIYQKAVNELVERGG